jgi:PAS domain S-box-containing protein
MHGTDWELRIAERGTATQGRETVSDRERAGGVPLWLRAGAASALIVTLGAFAIAAWAQPVPLIGVRSALGDHLVLIVPIVVAVGMLAALAIGGMARRMLQPLEPLARAMEEIARGGRLRSIEPAGSREVQEAIGSFNRMLDQVRSTQEALEETNRNLEHIVAERTQEMRRSEQKYRSLVGQAAEGILLWDPETLQILEANARAGELLGQRPRDLLKQTFDSVFPSEARDPVVRILRSVSETGAATLEEVEVVRKGHAHFPAEVSASLVRFGDEQVGLGIVRDLTIKRDLQRKAALLHEQGMEAKKMASIGLLAAGVAHEINNPMGYVASNVNRLAEYAKRLGSIARGRRSEDRTEMQDLLGELDEIANETREGVERVTEIVRALREFAHGGSDESAYAWVDPNRIVRNCVTLVHNQLKNRAEVDLHLEAVPRIFCHPTQVAQVLMNLLLNSADALEDPGRIEISSYDSGDRIHISVEDNGAGIDRSHLGQIFEPFFTTKSAGRGTGLGLAVSREIVRRHHGDLTVDSVPGRGTRFLLELPREIPVKETR